MEEELAEARINLRAIRHALRRSRAQILSLERELAIERELLARGLQLVERTIKQLAEPEVARG